LTDRASAFALVDEHLHARKNNYALRAVILGSFFGTFCYLKKYHGLLKVLAFPTAFQADDEGSIPFNRSK
jgi:hypothetical protein